SDGWPFMNISSIAVDPTNPQNVYVGTGDFHGYEGHPFGMMRSTDGGATWNIVGASEFGTVAVSKIVIDPETPANITVSTGFGDDYFGYVWRSTDGGS